MEEGWTVFCLEFEGPAGGIEATGFEAGRGSKFEAKTGATLEVRGAERAETGPGEAGWSTLRSDFEVQGPLPGPGFGARG